MMEKNYVFIKSTYHNTHKLSKKKDVLEMFVLQEMKNFNLFDKNHSQDNVKCHIQNEES